MNARMLTTMMSLIIVAAIASGCSPGAFGFPTFAEVHPQLPELNPESSRLIVYVCSESWPGGVADHFVDVWVDGKGVVVNRFGSIGPVTLSKNQFMIVDVPPGDHQVECRHGSILMPKGRLALKTTCGQTSYVRVGERGAIPGKPDLRETTPDEALHELQAMYYFNKKPLLLELRSE